MLGEDFKEQSHLTGLRISFPISCLKCLQVIALRIQYFKHNNTKNNGRSLTLRIIGNYVMQVQRFPGRSDKC